MLGALLMIPPCHLGQFAIFYSDLVIMAAERGLEISHTTPMRWVLRYAPKLAKKIKSHLKEIWPVFEWDLAASRVTQ
jgi:transposase-like protein